jgi:hypothetical protein
LTVGKSDAPTNCVFFQPLDQDDHGAGAKIQASQTYKISSFHCPLAVAATVSNIWACNREDQNHEVISINEQKLLP